ncbi:MAG: hypothetical protein Q9173_004134 [Seirophora scorigena]
MAAGHFLIDEELAAGRAKAMTGIPLMFFEALLGCNDLTARAAFDVVYVANMLLECSFIDEVFRAQMAVAMPGAALMCLKTFAKRESLLAGGASMGVVMAAMIVERSIMNKRPMAQKTETVSRGPLMIAEIIFRSEEHATRAAAARKGMHIPIMIAQGPSVNKIPIALLAPEMDIPVMLVEILFALEMPLAHRAKAMERSALVLAQSLVTLKGSITGVAAERDCLRDPVAKYGRRLW